MKQDLHLAPQHSKCKIEDYEELENSSSDFMDYVLSKSHPSVAGIGVLPSGEAGIVLETLVNNLGKTKTIQIHEIPFMVPFKGLSLQRDGGTHQVGGRLMRTRRRTWTRRSRPTSSLTPEQSALVQQGLMLQVGGVSPAAPRGGVRSGRLRRQ